MGRVWRCNQGHEYDPTVYGYPSESGDPCPTCARERRDEAMRAEGANAQRARERRERQGASIDVQTPSTIEIEREELRGLLDEAKADHAALQAQVEALRAERDRLREQVAAAEVERDRRKVQVVAMLRLAGRWAKRDGVNIQRGEFGYGQIETYDECADAVFCIVGGAGEGEGGADGAGQAR